MLCCTKAKAGVAPGKKCVQLLGKVAHDRWRTGGFFLVFFVTVCQGAATDATPARWILKMSDWMDLQLSWHRWIIRSHSSVWFVCLLGDKSGTVISAEMLIMTEAGANQTAGSWKIWIYEEGNSNTLVQSKDLNFCFLLLPFLHLLLLLLVSFWCSVTLWCFDPPLSGFFYCSTCSHLCLFVFYVFLQAFFPEATCLSTDPQLLPFLSSPPLPASGAPL